jgi:hypothetical protein
MPLREGSVADNATTWQFAPSTGIAPLERALA